MEIILEYLLYAILALMGGLILLISIKYRIINRNAIKLKNEELWNQYAETSKNPKHYTLTGDENTIRVPIKYKVAKKKGYLPEYIKNNKEGKFIGENGGFYYSDASDTGFFDISNGSYGGSDAGDSGGGGGD